MCPRLSTVPDTRNELLDQAKSYYDAQLRDGVDRFFGERVTECPWCGSAALSVRVVCRDLRQLKPGEFRLDECGDCHHVFQNPALTDEGLDFYYRDTYDGLNAERAETNLGSMGLIYQSRAETVAHHRPDAPRRWLDVGTASGHFPQAASLIFPDTQFDGLDMSEGVLAAKEAGRIQTAYQGQFPDLVDSFRGQYDQVSMFHYLEHTRDPFADLDAAVAALTDNGWLEIEQPDPECRAARLFGARWPGWNQPEHLHMVTQSNLIAALEARGMTIEYVAHREAHIPLEAFIVVAGMMNSMAPDENSPWRNGAESSRWRRTAAKALVAPLVPPARLIDTVVLPRMMHSYHAYRVLARKRS